MLFVASFVIYFMFNYYFFVLGCQFNYYDAEKLAILFDSSGGTEVIDAKDADLAIIFACSVRQKAVDKILGHIRNWKKKNNKLKVIVTACILPPDKKKLSTKVDSIINERELIKEHSHILKNVGVKNSIKGERRCASSRTSNYQLYNSRTAYVTISAGCNNFCTYCAVPHTRGRELSKPAPVIIGEIIELAKQGIDHIILLGQNVNSYGLSDFKPRDMRKNKSPEGKKWTPSNPSPFVRLLREVDKISGIKYITYLSPNPQDMSEDIIDWMANSPKFSKNLNLPMQSGSTRILGRMNRRYSRTEYLRLVKNIRKAVPDIFLSTDIIVGFPGEIKKDYENTVSAVKICKFNKAFIAPYSRRLGTAAALMDDNVPYKEKKRRWRLLDKMINS